MQDLAAIGQQARTRRKQQGLSQQDAAERIQAHRNEISRIENGHFRGSVATLTRYLNLLGLALTTAVYRKPVLEDLSAIFDEEDR